MNTITLTAIAMIAFAANSLFCRLALGPELIDPASFMTIRIVAGALTLSLIMLPRWRRQSRIPVAWRSVAALFVYMIFFSFAYFTLAAGTGALLLFGAVQLTMFAVALGAGERFTPLAWAGLLSAMSGIVYLVSPGVTAPDPFGAVLMVVAGVAWGVYSLYGRNASAPLEATANNFIFCVPLTLAVSLIFSGDAHVSGLGAAYAVASGALASGLGYVVWYAALGGLSTSHAATVQLSVPVLAAIGGVLFISEPVGLRLLLASVATLGGIAMVLSQRIPKTGSGGD